MPISKQYEAHTILKSLLPERTRSWLRDRRDKAERGLILFDRVTNWNVLRRLRPYRPEFGRRRGACIDRLYIEEFLNSHKDCIRGRVAEFESDDYTRKFGEGRIEASEILDVNEQNTRRTLTLDLMQPATVPEASFDCVICTQTLLFIRDYRTALESLWKMLKPGGILLATVPGICPVVRGNLIAGAGEDYWRFTSSSARRIFAEVFADGNVAVHTYGNVLSAVAFLHGLVQAELSREELEFHDPPYELIIGIAATKAPVDEEHEAQRPLAATEDLEEPNPGAWEQMKYRVPKPVRHWLNLRREVVERKMIHVDRVTQWSVLRRVHPYRQRFGERRGECIDRYYIEKFLEKNQQLIHGRVAEFLDNGYTIRFGRDRVTESDVIDIDENNQQRTVTLDLAQTDSAPESLFDTILCTQTLLLIFDFPSAIRTLHKMLKPGGVVLTTVPGICRRLPHDMLDGGDADWWRFTGRSAELTFSEAFGAENVSIQTFGNVLTTTAFLHGLVQEELTAEELAFKDPDFELVIGIKATKAST
ncbi:MAG TPA: methyltransferase domain-containing protein [Terracidiphilus sp.]